MTEIGERDQVVRRCHGASHEGRLVGVVGFQGNAVVDRALALFPEGIDDRGRFTDPAGWELANRDGHAKWYMNISNRIVLYKQRAYIATGLVHVGDEKYPDMPPSVAVLCCGRAAAR